MGRRYFFRACDDSFPRVRDAGFGPKNDDMGKGGHPLFYLPDQGNAIAKTGPHLTACSPWTLLCAMNLDLIDKTALISGSTKGIGFGHRQPTRRRRGAGRYQRAFGGRRRFRLAQIKEAMPKAKAEGFAGDLATAQGTDELLKRFHGGRYPGQQPRHFRAEAVRRDSRRGLAAVLRSERPQRRPPQPRLRGRDEEAKVGPGSFSSAARAASRFRPR